MENFVVSARKYRPARFEDVIGQPQVTNTLKNALKQKQLAQAFLFCGPRGVGKTTCARILAKVVNCDNPTADFEACNECESCKAFNENASFNVHEMDAASNNSVEDIRSLVEQVRYAPQEGKRKIYIIDEVHMLSSNAFNAFLKTLEEPPAHAIFILATTEKHKIIPTILSRCQIFDFKRIRIEDMAKHLAMIAQRENISAEPDALHLIAQKADGALRDALSIFDRISIFGNNKITFVEAMNGLNVLDYDYFFQLTDFYLAEDIASALSTFNEILQKGFDGDIFMNGMSDHLRNLLVCKNSQTIQLLETAEKINARYKEQSAYSPAAFLISALSILNDSEIQFRTSKNKRLATEIALIKLCNLKNALSFSLGNGSDSGIKKKLTSAETSGLRLTTEPAQPKYEKPITDITNSDDLSTETSIKAETKISSKDKVIPVDLSVTISTKTEIKPTEKKVKSSFGLSGLKNLMDENTAEKKNVDEVIVLDDSPLPPIPLNAFEEAKTKLLEHFRVREIYSVENVLKMYPPEIDENNAVKIVVSNAVHQNFLEPEKENISEFLKTELNLTRLPFYIIIDKSKAKTESTQKVYTPHDKFEFMAKQNPALLKLKEKLKLDIDY